ncbi:uncharacterized protein LOC122253424 [Penaeus japonicus]|uniref:uncharacterized protein LOC122253424 n=1 Tax=Penaeus japonicus TaxID=27405 RepID=UPI001C70E387|nr:uncharacterized protein LOC122253424 [Penaeus japonicus]
MAEGPHDLIERRHVEATLTRDKGPDARLLSWTIEDFTQKGDNFATFVTSVNVKYSLDNMDQLVSYVIKINPLRKGSEIDEFTRSIIQKEINFYTEILPDLNSALESAGFRRLRIPTFYFAEKQIGREMLFFEDLRSQGFKMADRKKGLDAAHTYLVLKELARFHAVSHILQAKIKDLSDRYPHLKIDWVTSIEEQRQFLQNMLASQTEHAISLLKIVKGYEKVLHWATRIQRNSLDLLKDQVVRIGSPFEVICHGDCYNNNLLFKYDASGAPVDVVLLDLQATRVASLGTDLSYLLLTSLEGSLMSSSEQDFLMAYYKSFSDVTKAAGQLVPFSFEDLRKEFRSKHPYGFVFSLIIIPFIVMNSSDIPEAEEFLSGKNEEGFKQKMIDALESNPFLRPRFLSVLDYAIEAGIVD